MRLLNVPPVKPGQRFKFSDGAIVYRLREIRWSHALAEWDAVMEVIDAGTSTSRAGSEVNFFIWSDDKLEILNDESTTG